MGFLSQVPLSACFLLYRALCAARLQEPRAYEATTERGIPRGPSRANKGGKGKIPCRQYFTFALTIAREFLRLIPGPTFYIKVHPGFRRKNAGAHGGGGGIFLLTLRPTSIRKVHLRVSRKNATAALRPTTVNGHSIFEKRYTESFSPTVQQAIRAFCRLCLFLFQSPAFSFRQG